ncbi:hypothetical protein EDC94DRAFT_632264 [Helicostylum pulchrum]|nr:hypothetical protein EDC94DRAFT_632264 [Helicostylum pulchrum]
MTEIYNNINSWKEKSSFACVNSFFHSIANLSNTLPAATARTVHLNLNFQLKQAFLDRLLVTFTKTNSLCKTAARKGINVTIVSSDQKKKKIIEDIMKCYEKNPMKRLAPEVELTEVPVNQVNRQIFFLKQSLELTTTIKVKQKEEIIDGVKYEHVNGLKLDTQPMLVNGHNKILEQVRRFVNCITKFDNHSILVTSFDLFWHNQPSHGDSAFGLDASDFYTTPVCKLKKKITMNKGFKEISMYFGMIELLMVGGYVFTGDQYFKSCSYKLWDYHSLHTYLKEFIPIIPVHFYGHASQKHKAFNIYHFASELLYLFFTHTTFYGNAMKNYLDGQEAKYVYVKLLVKVAIEMEAKCPNYPAGIFGFDNERKNALDIIMDGLKETIRKQNVANVMTRKKELRL